MTSNTILKDQNVLVSNGEIKQLGDANTWSLSVDTAETPEIINAEGTYLIPGFAEMHAHVPSEVSGQTAIDRVLELNLANGVVLIRGMLGETSHLALREQLKSSQRLGPELVTSGPSLSGNSVSSRRQAVTLVRQQHAAGYDFIKLHPGLSRDQYQAAIAEGQRLGISLAGHVSIEVGLEQSLLAQQATIDHLDGYAQAMIPEGNRYERQEPGFFGISIAEGISFENIMPLAVQTAREQVWNVPTETLMHNVLGELAVEQLLAQPEMRYVDAETLQSWSASVRSIRDDSTPNQRARLLAMRQQLLFALHQADAGLLLGSDAPQIFNVPGFALHRELQAMVIAGLDPYDALKMATYNVGQFLKRKNWGTVQTGAPANLLLLDKNPLDDIKNTKTIRAVMHNGRWHRREQLDALLAKHQVE